MKTGGRLQRAAQRDNYNKVKDAVSLEVQSAYYNYVQAVERHSPKTLAKACENEEMALNAIAKVKFQLMGYWMHRCFIKRRR